MRKFIILSIFAFQSLSCSPPSENKEAATEPEVKQSEQAGHQVTPGLNVNPELVGNPEEHLTFDMNSELSVLPIETYMYDLDSDGQVDKIELFNFKEYEGDPGDFNRIRIQLANGKVLDEFNLGIRGNSHMPTNNEVQSDLITIAKFEGVTFVMTYGWYFASDPPELTIFEFSTGAPRRIFAQNFATEELVLADNTILTGFKSCTDRFKPVTFPVSLL